MDSASPRPPHATPADAAMVGRIFDGLVTRAGEPCDEKQGALDVLSDSERALYVLRAASEHVTRGGFEQLYFFLPHLAGETASAAERVKARAFRRLFEQANAIAFADGPRKRSQSQFRRMMQAVQSNDAATVLARLDDEFDALMAKPSTSIDAYLAAFVENHASEFNDYDPVRGT